MYFPCPLCKHCCLCLYFMFLGTLRCLLFLVMSCLDWLFARPFSFVLMLYKKMPKHRKYIQSLSCSCSVRSLVESGYVCQHYHPMPWRDSISQPIAPVSLVSGGDDITRPRRQGKRNGRKGRRNPGPN
jgi:hypothetical protein